MIASDLKSYYSRFLKGHEGKLHFAAHSHHFWPDATRDAQLQYWDDCALLSDEKWNKIFGEVIPKAQGHVARILNLKDPKQIAFAPNTHELTSRLLSLFLGKPRLKILTSTSEFHSWRRQLLRLSELPEVSVEAVSTNTLLSHRSEFIGRLKSSLLARPDLFFISQVFFDSGLALTDQELLELYEAKAPETVMVIDGYHAFGALPTDLSSLEGKVFYLAGGYKYAQAGEGAGFLVVPKGNWRPAYTGWFAEYGDLSRPAGAQVGYTNDGLAFIGATQDPSGLYRFNAVWDLFQKAEITVEAIHQFVVQLQEEFLQGFTEAFLKQKSLTPFIPKNLNWHGHFLTFEAASESEGQAFQEELKQANILIDRRGKRLRFGFGLYQDKTDVLNLIRTLSDLNMPR